jgi:hypothetical protein
MTQKALERLDLGDKVACRPTGAGSLASFATSIGVTPHVAEKALWLARKYPTEERELIGREVLEKLSPSHLEVAARLQPPDRIRALKLAVRDQLSVRALKSSVEATVATYATVSVLGGNTLADAARVLSTYDRLPDEGLRKLLSGPAGGPIEQLANIARRVGDRIQEVMAMR